ncbi:MAG: hypothetical protein SFZ24_01130 [Planctomycetota bacterium]|nr:hypothetical protein [Planctomycetota bacterium]
MLSVAGLLKMGVVALALAGGLLGLAGPAAAAEPETITEEGVIAGTMDIDFGTRSRLDTSGDLKPGSAAVGAADVYKFALRVAQTTEFSGELQRLPNLYTKTLQRKKQDASLAFDINLAVLNPKDLKQKKVVGKWVGLVPIDPTSGAYELAGSKERPLRIAIDAVGAAKSFTDPFGGRMVGKAEKKDNLAQYTFKRVVGNKTVAVTVKHSDPMRFDNIVLAKGPSENYARTSVSGRLDYDYETGNWYTDGIRFRYTLDGKEHEDVVTGSIKWVEDPARDSNGKGYYDFNLRWNEEKAGKASTESAAFESMSEEDAFFAVDNSIPCLTGRISYVDTFASGSEAPASSKVTYALNANKLTKQQIMNFFKLWMICTGPTNDE